MFWPAIISELFVYKINSKVINEEWVGNVFDKVGYFLKFCIHEWRQVSFDELYFDPGSFPNFEDGTPDSSMSLDAFFDMFGPMLVGYTDCCLLVIGDEKDNPGFGWLFMFGLFPFLRLAFPGYALVYLYLCSEQLRLPFWSFCISLLLNCISNQS